MCQSLILHRKIQFRVTTIASRFLSLYRLFSGRQECQKTVGNENIRQKLEGFSLQKNYMEVFVARENLKIKRFCEFLLFLVSELSGKMLLLEEKSHWHFRPHFL